MTTSELSAATANQELPGEPARDVAGAVVHRSRDLRRRAGR